MQLTHHSRLSLRTTKRARAQRGYILVTFGFLLVPLLLMVGLSVDVGSWYQRSSDIQKAADSAALAGVVWLPDFSQAERFAREAARRNGFEDGGDISVAVNRVPGHPRQLRVDISDRRVGSFFYQNLGGRKIGLSRAGTAEYVLPVPLGSPRNQFGGVDGKSDLAGSGAPGLWGNIHGYGTDNSKGDAFTPECTTDNCSPPNNVNPDHRTSGYRYAIDVPPGGVYDIDVQIYDGGLVDRGKDESVDTGDRQYAKGSSTTIWTLEKPNGSTLDVDSYVPVTSADCSSGGSGRWELASGDESIAPRNAWTTLCKRNGYLPEGRYILRVQTQGNGSTANRYAVRALSSGTKKVRVSAYGDMSMYNNIGTSSGGASVSAEFYLAEITPENRGKTLELNLYDPGEVTGGNGTMRVLAPGGSVAPNCKASSDSPKRTFTNGAVLSPCQFNTAVGGQAKFDGSWVTLLITIPNNYTCTPDTIPGCWWKMQYEITGQANDTTTWAARVIGDPVHLVENF